MRSEPWLREFFGVVRNMMAVYPRCRLAHLVLIDQPCSLPGKCSFRDLGYAVPLNNPPLVVLQRRILSFPVENIEGLMLHELGHIADDGVANAGRERIADALAEAATGIRIFYDENSVQTTLLGNWPRPAHLHQ